MPIIQYENQTWYPVRLISEKVLLRISSILTKKLEVDLGLNCKVFNVDYGKDTGSIQKVKCVTVNGFKELIKKFKTGGYDENQKIGYNNLIIVLGLESEFELLKFIDVESKMVDIQETIKSYNTYIQDIIKEVLEENPNIEWKACTRCGHVYPEHKAFFNKDNGKSNTVFMSFCKDCGQGGKITVSKESYKETKEKTISKTKIADCNQRFSRAYNNYGEEYYNYLKNNDTINIYKYCKENNVILPIEIRDKDSLLKIIKYEHETGNLTKYNTNTEFINNLIGMDFLGTKTKISEVHKFLFGENYWNKPWEYKIIRLPKLTYEQGKIILNNYIKDFNIKIDNILEYNKYGELTDKAKLKQFQNNLLDFIVYYYDNQYAGYKFKLSGVNYYKSKDRRIFDLKYFIEKDLKLEIEKIPLYITKMCLQRNARSLYNILYNGTYYKNLFEWINDIYPDRFNINDFIINPYRSEFDSDEECQINDILSNNFSGVIYNQRNTDRTINIDGMIPDWVVHRDNGCWLIEYFGLYVKNKSENTRIDDYIKKTDEKIDKYKRLSSYKFLDLYPKDLEDNYKGIYEKLKLIG